MATKCKRAYRLSVPEVLRFARAYYNDHPTGGSLHIVLDDGNIELGNVEYCIKYAEEHNDAPGAALGRLLRYLTRTQRDKLYHQLHEQRPTTAERFTKLVVQDGKLVVEEE
jgi:hypothetical protein